MLLRIRGASPAVAFDKKRRRSQQRPPALVHCRSTIFARTKTFQILPSPSRLEAPSIVPGRNAVPESIGRCGTDEITRWKMSRTCRGLDDRAALARKLRLIFELTMMGVISSVPHRIPHRICPASHPHRIGAVGAILTNFVAAIYLRMNAATSENLAAFHSRLVETHELMLGNLLASRIDNDGQR
jgi:hypothetical protein